MLRDAYQEMFGLSADDLQGHLHILEYSDVSRAVNEASHGLPYTLMHYAPSAAHGALPFDDFSFDCALCPHSLFVDDQTVDVLMAIIRELARVAKEVRIFPLSDTQGLPSPLLGPVLLGLNQENYGVEVRDVTSSQPSKGNAILRVWAQQCQVS